MNISQALGAQTQENTPDRSAKNFAAPFLAAIVGIMFVVILVYPIMKLSPHNIPVAITSADEGYEMAGQTTMAGDQFVDQLTSDDGDSALAGDMLDWTVFDSESELDKAMDAGDYYLAIVIPSDFSERMVTSKVKEATGATLEDADKPAIDIVINQGKNPMVTNSIEPYLSTFQTLGVNVNTSYSVELPEEMQRGFSHMPLMIMTYLTSYIAGAVIAMKLSPSRTSRKSQAKGLLIQCATSLVVALFVGFSCALVYQAMLGLSIDWVQLGLLMALSSFALQMIVVGCLDLFGIVGMIVPLLLMAFCMTSAYLPYEFLPSFWQENIYPWNPLRIMVDAYKNVIYMGEGFWNNSTPYIFVVIGIGLVIMALNLVKKPAKE